MKRILDPTFRYRPSFDTDVRKTIAAFRRKQGTALVRAPKPTAEVLLLPSRERRSPK